MSLPRRLAQIALVLALTGGALAILWPAAVRRFGLGPGGHPGPLTLPRLDVVPVWLHTSDGRAPPTSAAVTVAAFFSDTDPEALDALPLLQDWHRAYAAFGVRVIGVHQPDYAFASDSAVVARLARRLGLGFPLALDPAHRVPRDRPGFEVLLADDAGRVVLRGDGTRDALRAMGDAIQKRVATGRFVGLEPLEAGRGRPGLDTTAPGAGTAARRDVPLGAGQVAQGPLAAARINTAQLYASPFRFEHEGPPYTPYPAGRWSAGGEGVTAVRGGAANLIAIRYDARDVEVVMAPPAEGPVRVWLLADDAWLGPGGLGADARQDGRGASYVDVTEPRLYAVARTRGTHVLKLSPERAGVTLYRLIFRTPTAEEPTRP